MYRITKRYYREQETAQVKYYYIIEERTIDRLKSILTLKKTFKWTVYQDFYWHPYWWITVNKRFSSLAKAKTFVSNLQEPILPDEH